MGRNKRELTFDERLHKQKRAVNNAISWLIIGIIFLVLGTILYFIAPVIVGFAILFGVLLIILTLGLILLLIPNYFDKLNGGSEQLIALIRTGSFVIIGVAGAIAIISIICLIFAKHKLKKMLATSDNNGNPTFVDLSKDAPKPRENAIHVEPLPFEKGESDDHPQS